MVDDALPMRRGRHPATSTLMTVGHAPTLQEQFDPRLSWADVEWVKKEWGGALILKGIMDPEDAAMAAQAGADAIIVSNRRPHEPPPRTSSCLF